MIYPDPDADSLLRRLKGRGLRLGVISNHIGTLKRNLLDVRLAGYFDLILDAHDVGVRKPDPEIFRLACHTLGVSPGEAAHVGDEPLADVTGANAVGVAAVLVDPLGLYGERYAGLPYKRTGSLRQVGLLL